MHRYPTGIEALKHREGVVLVLCKPQRLVPREGGIKLEAAVLIRTNRGGHLKARQGGIRVRRAHECRTQLDRPSEIKPTPAVTQGGGDSVPRFRSMTRSRYCEQTLACLRQYTIPRRHWGYSCTLLHRALKQRAFDFLRFEDVVCRIAGQVHLNVPTLWQHSFTWMMVLPGLFGKMNYQLSSLKVAATPIFSSSWSPV